MSRAPTPPPTVPYVPIPAKLPAWPKVIGILHIVYASLLMLGGIMGGIYAVIFTFISSAVGNAAGNAQEAAMFEAMGTYIPIVSCGWFINGLLGIVLLIAGIKMIKRQPQGASLTTFWTWAETVTILVMATMQGFFYTRMFDAMSAVGAGPGGGPAMPAGFSTGMGVATAIFIVVFGLIYPVFLFIWMSRRSVRDHIAEWPLSAPTITRYSPSATYVARAAEQRADAGPEPFNPQARR